MSAFGATVGQSLNRVVVASTTGASTPGPCSRATSPDPTAESGRGGIGRTPDEGGLNLGVMMRFGVIKVGGALKHVGEPAFDDGTSRVVLKRQARAGVALTKGRIGVFDSLIAAVDVDLTENATVLGDVPQLACGGEARLVATAWRFVEGSARILRLIGDRSAAPGRVSPSGLDCTWMARSRPVRASRVRGGARRSAPRSNRVFHLTRRQVVASDARSNRRTPDEGEAHRPGAAPAGPELQKANGGKLGSTSSNWDSSRTRRSRAFSASSTASRRSISPSSTSTPRSSS